MKLDHPKTIESFLKAIQRYSDSELRYRYRMVARYINAGRCPAQGVPKGNISPDTRYSLYMLELVRRGLL